ncbi:MAG TPA: efflux RND transporter permease subunit, partial [Spirochaetia bacterium]|nr:efflux RND transporter permease subunit [Spirochaetia bacterium]
MRLPKLAVENHHFTVIIVVLLVVFGIWAYFTMPRAEDPQISVPAVSVIVLYPGASSVDLERLVVDPIEEAANE